MPLNHPFVKKIATALHSHCGVGKAVTPTGADACRLVVAVSGGADSVALLRALSKLSRTRVWHLELIVAHVHHHLRDAAKADADFVEALADRLNLPYHRRDLDLTSAQGNLEAQARTQRYRALADVAAQASARYVVTAHHGDDQLETLLMRLLRGGSVRGLSCMAWRRPLPWKNEAETGDSTSSHYRTRSSHPSCLLWLIRPMLSVNRAEVIQYLKDIDQPWREDHTNADLSRLRARLRHDVLPIFHDLSARVDRRAVELADHFRQLHRLVEQQIDQAQAGMVRGADPLTITRDDARLLDAVVLSGLLRRLLIQAGVGGDQLSRHGLKPIIRAVHDQQGGERRFSLSNEVQVLVNRESVRIERGSER